MMAAGSQTSDQSQFKRQSTLKASNSQLTSSSGPIIGCILLTNGDEISCTRREKIIARLEWSVAQVCSSAPLHLVPRLVSIYRSVEVWLAETAFIATAVAGMILDISISGAPIALHADPGPFFGGLVRIESRFATVIRTIETGIAVQFVEPLTAANFDEWVRL